MSEQYTEIKFIDEPATLTEYLYISNGLCFEYFVGGHVGKCKDCSNKWLREHRVKKKLNGKKCKETKFPDNFAKKTCGRSTLCNTCLGN